MDRFNLNGTLVQGLVKSSIGAAWLQQTNLHMNREGGRGKKEQQPTCTFIWISAMQQHFPKSHLTPSAPINLNGTLFEGLVNTSMGPAMWQQTN